MPTIESERPVQESGQAEMLAAQREIATTPEEHAALDQATNALRDADSQALNELYDLAGDDPEQLAILDAERAAHQKNVATSVIPKLAVSETGIVLTKSEASEVAQGEPKEYGQGGPRS